MTPRALPSSRPSWPRASLTRRCSRCCAGPPPTTWQSIAWRRSSVRSAPRPRDRAPTIAAAGDGIIEVAPDPSADPVVYVFKTLADPYVGKVSMFKVVTGTVRPDVVLTNARTHGDERLHALFTMRGKEHIDVADVPAGDIAAVAKLTDTAPRATRSLPRTRWSPYPRSSFLNRCCRSRSARTRRAMKTNS